MKRDSGFTLIEVMTALAILALLAAIAAPSLTTTVQNGRIASQANDLLAAFASARNEAIRRGLPVSVSAGVAGGGAGYEAGWCIHTGANCAGAEIFVHEALNQSGVQIAESATQVTFDRLGQKTAPGADFVITLSPVTCPAGDERIRQITIQATGRGSIQRLSCP